MNQPFTIMNHFFVDKNNKSTSFWDKDFRKLLQNERDFTLNNEHCICLYCRNLQYIIMINFIFLIQKREISKSIHRKILHNIRSIYFLWIQCKDERIYYFFQDLKGFRKLENVYMRTAVDSSSYPYQIQLIHNQSQVILYSNSEQNYNQIRNQLENTLLQLDFQTQLFYSNQFQLFQSFKFNQTLKIQAINFINQIGFGSTAQVYISKSQTNGQCYAIKRIRKSSKLNPQFLMEEIQVMNELSHPNIIKLYKVFETNKHINMVLELVEGGELLKSHRYNLKDARIIIKQLAICVDYMHQKGIMHRDLKPQNILCKTNSVDIVLADFGLATWIKDKQHIYYRCGTTGYVAPEILKYKEGTKMYTEKCDIFSLGVILYQLIYNIHPFKDIDKTKVLQKNLNAEFKFEDSIKVPQSCKDLITLMLKQSPKQRPTAAELLRHDFFNEQLYEQSNSNLTMIIQETYSDIKRSGPSLSFQNVDMKFSTINNGFKQFEDEVDDKVEQQQGTDFVELSPIWTKRIDLHRCSQNQQQANSMVIQRQYSAHIEDYFRRDLQINRFHQFIILQIFQPSIGENLSHFDFLPQELYFLIQLLLSIIVKFINNPIILSALSYIYIQNIPQICDVQDLYSQDVKRKKSSIFRSEFKQKSIQITQSILEKSQLDFQDYHQIPYVNHNNMLLIHMK